MWQQTNNKKGLRDGKTCQECQYLDSIFLSLDRVKTVDRVDMQWCVSVTFTSLHSNCRHTNTVHCVCMYTIWMICPLPVKISTRYLLVEAGYDAKKRHQVKVDKSVQCTLLSTFTCALCLITQLPGPCAFGNVHFCNSLSSWRDKMDFHSVTFTQVKKIVVTGVTKEKQHSKQNTK